MFLSINLTDTLPARVLERAASEGHDVSLCDDCDPIAVGVWECGDRLVATGEGEAYYGWMLTSYQPAMRTGARIVGELLLTRRDGRALQRT